MTYGTGMLGLMLASQNPIAAITCNHAPCQPLLAVLLSPVYIAEHPTCTHWHRINNKMINTFAARLACSLCHNIAKLCHFEEIDLSLEGPEEWQSWSWGGSRTLWAGAGNDVPKNVDFLLAAGRPCPGSAACWPLAWRCAVSTGIFARKTGWLCSPNGKQRPFPAASVKLSQFIQLVVLNVLQIHSTLHWCHSLKWNRSATTLSSTPMSSSLCFPSQAICVLLPNMCMYIV